MKELIVTAGVFVGTAVLLLLRGMTDSWLRIRALKAETERKALSRENNPGEAGASSPVNGHAAGLVEPAGVPSVPGGEKQRTGSPACSEEGRPGVSARDDDGRGLL